MTAAIFGQVTMIAALGMVFIGLPTQIIKNYREKRSGQSILLAGLALVVYFSRACYAFSIGSWYIFVPDTIGAIFSVAVVCQHFYYRPKKETH